jgi:hypothetical protein
MVTRRLVFISSLFAAALALVGCSGMSVPIQDPTPSSNAYATPTVKAPTPLNFNDARSTSSKAALTNDFLGLTLLDAKGDQPLDAPAYLARNIVKEMATRGLPVSASTNKDPNAVTFKRIFVEARRVSGFSPFETYTTISAEVTTSKGKQKISTFVKRGKLPIWTLSEVNDPTFNAAMDIAVKDLAAKLSRILYDAKISDTQVDALIAKTSGAKVEYADVYELGYGLNPRAIPHLIKLAPKVSGEELHATLASLGLLRANEALPLLMKYAASDSWEDRATALKAIGDLGSPDAIAFLRKEAGRLSSKSDSETVRSKTILAMYLY